MGTAVLRPGEGVAEAPTHQHRFKAEVLDELNRHPYLPPVWLRNPHLQSSWSVFFRERPEVGLRKERWETPDGDFLSLYFSDGDPTKPTLLLSHGLEGSARSNYILGLMDAFGAQGWNCLVFEHRSCGEEMNQTQLMYHSGETRDLDFVVDRLVQANPNIRLYVAGFSLGGNVTGKWLGTLGEEIPKQVRAAAMVCAPFDLTISGPTLDHVAYGAYTRWFLRTLIPKAVEKAEKYPGLLDPERIQNSKTFAEYDTHATAALYGFEDAQDYWKKVSCGQFLHGIRRPTLLISSADDPFNPPETLPWEVADHSPYLHRQFTERGGHVGFVYGTWKQSHHWAEEQILRFLNFYDSQLD